MKVGLFIPNATFDLPGAPEVGGIEMYAFELGEALLRHGESVVLFGGIPKKNRRHRQTCIPLRLSNYTETSDIWHWGTRFRKLVQRLHFASSCFQPVLEEKCDLMMVFKPYDFINAWRWKRKMPQMKVVMNYQGEDFFPTDRFWHRFLDWEYACSDENARLAGQRYGAKPEVIPNGVDTSFFQPRTISRNWKPFRLLSAGRLVGWKGLEQLMPAIVQHPSIEWHIAGDGPERESLENLARLMECSHRVHFHGVLESSALTGLMQECDAFAQPSVAFDACPTAVLQAMSSGLPVLMSPLVGLSQSFHSNVECVVVSDHTASGWAFVLEKMIARPCEHQQQIGLAARTAIEKSFSWNVLAGQVVSRLQMVIHS